MNEIELLMEKLTSYVSRRNCVIDAPLGPSGPWFLRIYPEGYTKVDVEWRQDKGLSVRDLSDTENCVVGQEPNRFFNTIEETLSEVLAILNIKRCG